MTRLNRILVGLLVVQLVLTAIVFLPRTLTSEAEGGNLFPDVEADRIIGLTIRDAQGNSIHLAPRGELWVLADADDYPAQEDKVPPLLDKIVGLDTDRLVTQTRDSHKRLKVAADEFERLVEFELEDGTRHQLYVGSSPTFRATHVRAEGQDEVYLTSDLSAQDVGSTAIDWVERIYFSVPREEIVALSLENAAGRFEFEKDGETWTMAGLAADETFNETSFQTLLSRVSSVSMLRPLGKEVQAAFGLDEPSAVVTIRTSSGEGSEKTYSLTVGAQDPGDNSYVVISSESPYYVRVGEFAVKDLVEKVREDFLELLSTPTPEATPQG